MIKFHRHNDTFAIAASRQRGVAIVTAITLLALCGVCLAVLAVAFEHEIACTRQVYHRLQLQLLLTAGTVAIQQRVEAMKPSPTAVQPMQWQLALPLALKRKGASVRCACQPMKPPGHDHIRAVVVAAFDGLHARQAMMLVRHHGHWQLMGP